MAMIIPTRISVVPNPVRASASCSLIKVSPRAPIMAGIERRNENLKAFSRFSPNSKAIAMVVPLRESPGMMAMPCAVPNMRAVL